MDKHVLEQRKRSSSNILLGFRYKKNLSPPPPPPPPPTHRHKGQKKARQSTKLKSLVAEKDNISEIIIILIIGNV